MEDDAEIQVYTLPFERLEERTLSPQASVSRIADIRKDMT
jgi:hypothetical protein